MNNLKIMHDRDQPMIAEGKATNTIFTAFRKVLTEGDNGRVSGLDDGMYCDFFKLPNGEHTAFLISAGGHIVATADVDEFDR